MQITARRRNLGLLTRLCRHHGPGQSEIRPPGPGGLRSLSAGHAVSRGLPRRNRRHQLRALRIITTSAGASAVDCIAVTNPITITDPTYGTAIEGQIGTGTTPEYNARPVMTWPPASAPSTPTFSSLTGTRSLSPRQLPPSRPRNHLHPWNSDHRQRRRHPLHRHRRRSPDDRQHRAGAAGSGLSQVGTTVRYLHAEPVAPTPTPSTTCPEEPTTSGASTAETAPMPPAPPEDLRSPSTPKPAASTSISSRRRGTSTSGSITSGASIDYGTQLLLSARSLPAPSSLPWRTASSTTPPARSSYSHRNRRLRRQRHNHQHRSHQCRGRRRIQRSIRPRSPLGHRQVRRRQQLQQLDRRGYHLHRREGHAADRHKRGESGSPTAITSPASPRSLISRCSMALQVYNAQSSTWLYPVPIASPTGTVTVSGFPSGVRSAATLSPAVDPHVPGREGVATITAPASTPLRNTIPSPSITPAMRTTTSTSVSLRFR